MIKAIFFDIDGTLVTNRSIALESTKQAIKEAQAKGIFCGVATGRGPVNLMDLTDHLDLDMYVTYNGQFVYTQKEVLRAEAFTPEVLMEIVTFADNEKRQMLFGSTNKMVGSTTMMIGNSKFMKRFVRYLPKHFPIRGMKKILQKFSPHRSSGRYKKLSILEEAIYQCILLSPESELADLSQKLPNCSFQRSNPYSVDIVPKGGSKVKGIEAFLAEHEITLAETMAFGDSHNDNEMLAAVGIGVAMGNAQSSTKVIADYITETNENHGITQAMKHFKIID